MNKIGNIPYKLILRVSPSQYYSMQQCTYKIVLAEAFDKRPLLPLSPNAYFGTVIHKVLELIVKRQVCTESELNIKFDEEVRKLENTLINSSMTFFVPLQKNVKNFGLKKMQLTKYLRRTEVKVPNGSNRYISEKWFESKDGYLGGKIDLIIEHSNMVEIIDFKTGAITKEIVDDEGEVTQDIKPEYKDQLKLYAYLYYEAKTIFPNKLTLIDLNKQEYIVSSTIEDSKAVYLLAKELLMKVNKLIKEGQFDTLANPSFDNCKFCLFRPACSYYINYSQINPQFNDYNGQISHVTQYRNGNVSIKITSGNEIIEIIGFDSSVYELLNQSKGKRLGIYNLKRIEGQNYFLATKTTMIYEQ